MRNAYATDEARPNFGSSPFVAMPRELIEAIISAAIDELDSREGDPDLEDDEPETYATRFRLAVLWPGTPEDEEENDDREHDPAEHEAWEQPNWNVSATFSRPTKLFPARTSNS
jgi:hypothetical protein